MGYMERLRSLPRFSSLSKTKPISMHSIKYIDENIELPVDGYNRELLIIDDAEVVLLRGVVTKKMHVVNTMAQSR